MNIGLYKNFFHAWIITELQSVAGTISGMLLFAALYSFFRTREDVYETDSSREDSMIEDYEGGNVTDEKMTAINQKLSPQRKLET